MRTIAVDFDGVIHAYSLGWHDGTIYDEPIPGALAAIKTLQESYAVFVFTSRQPSQVAEWLVERGVPAEPDLLTDIQFWNDQEVVLVTDRKLPAVAYVDDRAVRFESWDQVLSDLKE